MGKNEQEPKCSGERASADIKVVDGVVVQLLSWVLFCDPMDCSTPGFTISRSLVNLMSIKSVMPEPSRPL